MNAYTNRTKTEEFENSMSSKFNSFMVFLGTTTLPSTQDDLSTLRDEHVAMSKSLCELKICDPVHFDMVTVFFFHAISCAISWDHPKQTKIIDLVFVLRRCESNKQIQSPTHWQKPLLKTTNNNREMRISNRLDPEIETIYQWCNIFLCVSAENDKMRVKTYVSHSAICKVETQNNRKKCL